MKLRRMLSCMMALLLAASLPVSAFADNWYLDDGDITVTASEGGQAVFQGGLISIPDSAPVITQSDSSTPTGHTVTIKTTENATANVTLQNVNIDTSSTGEAAVEITGNGDVIIELDGVNIVRSGQNHAGVEKNTTEDSGKGNLTITDENGTDGSLKATGGENGSGIGGGYESSTSNITISGGEVTAVGGDAPMVESGGDGLVPGAGGGSGIGGGAYGTGDNITVEKDAHVTAEGKGNAANIGNGHGHPEDLGSEYENDPTKEQPDNVNVEGLYTTGSVNGVSGTQDPSKNNNNGQPSGSDSHGYITYEINVDASIEYDYIAVLLDSLSIRVTDQNDRNLPSEFVVKNDTFTITAASDSAIVSGDRDGLKRLTDHGVKQTVLETNCVNLTISNDLLMQTTEPGESFQLSADGTNVSLTTTDESNETNIYIALTNGGTQQKIYAPLRLGGHSSPDGTDDDQLGSTLLVSTNTDKASLTLSGSSLQTLTDRGIDRTALSTSGLTSSFKNKDAMEKINGEYDAKLDFTIAILETDGEQSHCIIKQDDYATDAIETTSNSMLQQASKSILEQGNNKPQLGLSLLE